MKEFQGHVTITGTTESGAQCAGRLISIGPRAAIVEVPTLGRAIMYRDEIDSLFCRALGGRVAYRVVLEASA